MTHRPSVPLLGLPLFYLQSQMIVVGDALQVFGFCPIADVRVDVPTITFMLPDAARHCGAFVLADEVVAITMLDAYGRDALQTDLPECIDEGVDDFSSFVILIPIIVFYILFFCFSRVFT